MADLTEQARDNLAAGAEDGPGTSVCRGCGGPKEATRLNSARCRECGRRKTPRATASTGASTKTIRADIPADVWDRLDAEASAKGVPLGRHLRNLIVARDKKITDRKKDQP